MDPDIEVGTGHARAHSLATQRLAEIDAKLADLKTMRDALAGLVRRCEHTHGKVACPIIATLAATRPAAARKPSVRPRGAVHRRK
jgi:MerR family mercuric resistance operon transcriptional regulator